ncbi:hypothetical protein H0H81_003973 [Sphagnurus paluster]|uniref:Transmembrane protein n=1 Tax=Sphagnurus paluster TaxID=117069 RepID=A0A9P7GTL5_9AGAR|nr:hypothetical protein H0H81_003973 [Sphagnurus paluster]
MAKVVWDESQNGLNLVTGGGTWKKATVSRFFDGAALWPSFTVNLTTGDTATGLYATLSITFQGISPSFYFVTIVHQALGTQISLFGNTPIAEMSQYMLVSIDGGTPYNTSYGDPSPPTALQWYQSPVLDDGTHTLSITEIVGTSLDYAVVLAGPNTPLMGAGQVLIVDDGDPEIIYEGTWTQNTELFRSIQHPQQGRPYGNATHQSGTKGSKASFSFSGSQVSVYSVFDWSTLGSVTVTYTVDNNPQTITHAVTSQTKDYLQGVLQRENTLLFASNNLTAGNHTLTIEIVGNTNGSVLVLDYLLYTPSFQTLAEKLNPVPATSGSPTPSPSGFPAGSAAGEKSSTPVGAIAGGIVAGLAVLALLIFVFCRKWMMRREKAPKASGKLLSFRHYYDDEPRPSAGLIPFPETAPNNATTPVADADDRQYRKPPMPVVPMVATHLNSPSTRSGNPYASRSEITQKSATSLAPTLTACLALESASAPVMPLPTPLQPVSVAGSSGSMLRGRMQRLQALVTELNREIEVYGEGGVRVAELRGRIAELTREEEVGSVRLDARNPREDVPPPYNERAIDG